MHRYFTEDDLDWLLGLLQAIFIRYIKWTIQG